MGSPDDELSSQLRREALEALEDEPELCTLLHRTVLAPGVVTFEDAVASTVCYRLLLTAPSDGKNKMAQQQQQQQQQQAPGSGPCFCPNSLRTILSDAMKSDELEGGHTMSEAVREDALAACRRDPACDTLLEVVLFYKGYAALVCHRAARRKWNKTKNRKRSFTALFLQSQASAVFGLDIHPAATIGSGVLFDHGTGIVIGETAAIGDGCTLLHGVTLGGTGKEGGDRHPKVGKNVLIGAGASILGNIPVGDAAKIGAGSIVLRGIPAGATAVGAPAKIIGRALESKPGSVLDDTLRNVGMLHRSESMGTLVTASISSSTLASDAEMSDDGCPMCPFRDYTRMARKAPRGSITILTLGKLLSPLGCTHEEIGCVMFALDTDNVGHVHLDGFKERGAEAIEDKTSLGREQVDELMASYLREHPAEVNEYCQL